MEQLTEEEKIDEAMNLFSNTDFYDVNCNNERCRMQGLDISKLKMMNGLEFEVMTPVDPNVYVIKRQDRDRNSGVKLNSVYYILNEQITKSVYESPSVFSLIDSKIRRSLFLLNKGFQEASKVANHPLKLGQQWWWQLEEDEEKKRKEKEKEKEKEEQKEQDEENDKKKESNSVVNTPNSLLETSGALENEQKDLNFKKSKTKTRKIDQDVDNLLGSIMFNLEYETRQKKQLQQNQEN